MTVLQTLFKTQKVNFKVLSCKSFYEQVG